MKKRTFFAMFLVAFLLFPGLAHSNGGEGKEIRVMSFNIWMGGGHSVSRTLDVIKQSGADIVGIQESTKGGKNTAKQFAEDLGWHAHGQNSSTTIISRFPIVKTSATGIGAKFQIDEKRFVWFFNVHLMYCPYEPYQLNGIEYCGAPLLDTAEEAVASAWKTRSKAVEQTIEEIKDAQKEGYPIFLTGDFNEPSCLDWTEKAAKAGICKIPVKWPATAAFQERAGMIDSYRKLYPDETKNPGHTWTPLPAKKEVLDRIDFVFYHGRKVEVRKVQIVGESSDLSDIKMENYPSDHRAVLGTFVISDPE